MENTDEVVEEIRKLGRIIKAYQEFAKTILIEIDRESSMNERTTVQSQFLVDQAHLLHERLGEIK